MLFYLPLESYVERYTYFMSCRGGWTEDWLKHYGVEFVRVEGEESSKTINVGSVLDAFGRCSYAMSQVAKMVEFIRNGCVEDGDVIYTEDFWHPGIESLFYVRALTGIRFKVGCFIHAQSIDDADFTHSMRGWMRPMEVGMSHGYDYVFTCSHLLRNLAVDAGYNPSSLYKVGLPYNSRRLREQLCAMGFREKEKEPFVLFSSRFDAEKNPHLFMDVVEACPDVQFKLVKPRKHITNDQTVLDRLNAIVNCCGNLEVVDTSDKMVYYDLLSRAKVQFNCAKQDWVSWTLLEAVTFRCNPLYPRWKDFPFELDGFVEDHIYENEDLKSAVSQLRRLLHKEFDLGLLGIATRHDESWKSYLEVMELI